MRVGPQKEVNKIQILLRNISFNFFAQFWFLGLSFFTTPYIIKKLGVDAFGVYSIIGVVMGYFSFLDLGLGNAIIKYLAEYYGKKDYKKMSQIIGTSLFVYTIIGLFGASLLTISTGFIINQLLHIPQNLKETTYFALYVSALGFLINMPLAIYGNIPNALQRMDITNIRNIIIGTLNILGIVLILSFGRGLKEIVVLNVFLSIIGIIVYIIVSKRLLPEVSFRIYFDKKMFGQLLGFGIFKFLNQISGQIIFHLDKFLIGLFLPIAWVSYYTVPLTLSQKAMSLMFNIAGAFFPTASELSGREDKTPFYELYLRSMKMVSILVVPLFTTLFLYAREILTFWVKGDFPEKATLTLKLLALAYLIQSFTTVPSLAAESMGKPKVTAAWAGIAAFFNLIFCLLFIPIFKINGAAMAIFLNSLIVCPISVIYINKKIIKFSSYRLFFGSMFKAFLSIFLSLPFFFLLKIYLVRNLYSLILSIMAGGAIYLLICYLIGVIDIKDREIINAFFKKYKVKK